MKIGIDLGSSNTVAAIMTADGAPTLVPAVNRLGTDSTPSKIMMAKDRAYVGQFAEKMVESFPDLQLITGFKRAFGTTKTFAEFQGTSLTSDALAGLLLKKVKHDVEINTSRQIDISVITAPAHFNDKQRKTILRAAELAGLPECVILDEPIAAAMFYTHESKNLDDEIIMIYDLGGGTFDLTLLTYSANKLHIIAKAGLSDLGGRDFDDLIYTQLARDYEAVTGHAANKTQLAENRLRSFAEQMKMRISGEANAWTSDHLFLNRNFVQFNISDAQFLSQACGLLDRTQKLVTRTLRSVGMTLADVNRFVLTGGASNAEYVHRYWAQLVDPTRQKILRHQPLASIAKGAAIFAASLSKNQQQEVVSSYSMSNVSAYNVGIRTVGDESFIKVIDRNLPLPVSGRAELTVPHAKGPQLVLQLCQYIDQPADMDVIGELVINSAQLTGVQRMALNIDNKSDGTLGIKLKNSQTSQTIPFAFERNSADASVHQKIQTMFASIPINAI
jgi:molecular chaperone DnaK (HSP70)